MPTLNELGATLNQKRAEYKQKWDAYPTKTLADGTEAKDVPANDLEFLEKMRTEMDSLQDQVKRIQESEGYAAKLAEEAKNAMTPANRVESKTSEVIDPRLWSLESAGEMKRGFDMEFKEALPFERKTTMTTSAGYAPESIRSGVQIDTVQKQPNLMDYMTIVPVNQNSYKFMKEGTFTNAADVKAEGVAYGEAALTVTETTVSMERLGVYIPVTEDQLEDEPDARAYLERRLRDMVMIDAESQILTGSGTPPNWDGILNLSGIQTVDASGYDSDFDALHLAILNVSRSDATTYGGGNANLVVMSPADYHDLVTNRTSDGVYIYGNPADPINRRVYGLPIVVNPTITENTVLVMDTSFFPLGLRRGFRIAVTDSHGELFIAGTMVVRADIKGNVIAYRDAAAVKVTNF